MTLSEIEDEANRRILRNRRGLLKRDPTWERTLPPRQLLFNGDWHYKHVSVSQPSQFSPAGEDTCRVGFSTFFLSEAGSKVYARGSRSTEAEREIWRQVLVDEQKKEKEMTDETSSDKWRLCQGEGASSPAPTGRWKPMECLPWSTSNCTRTRKLESTNREQVAKPDDAQLLVGY